MSDELQGKECCPKFDPTPWDNRFFEWENRWFVKDQVSSLFYMPLNFEAVLKRLDEKIKVADAKVQDRMCLADHTSKWNIDIYLAVSKEIPDAENVSMTGKFYSRVYEGPYKNMKEWCSDFEENAKKQDINVKKMYMWYTTCPKCAKNHGKNYVVIVAAVE